MTDNSQTNPKTDPSPRGSLGTETTHAQLAAQLLRDAASFFRHLATENPTLQEQMQDNAIIYDEVAGLVEKTPNEIIYLKSEN